MAALAMFPAAAWAAAAPPKALGTFQHWTAATYDDGGQTVCYAFSAAVKSSPAVAKRGKVLLSVTERPGSRDEVALTAGYPYPAKAAVTLSVGQSHFDLYTASDAAFARDGAAAVRAFELGVTAETVGPAADGKARITDDFSLDGFTAAYKAILKACPGK
ncbi:MAG: invasion associated locus B family protein [Acetobacteraceae bacterium]